MPEVPAPAVDAALAAYAREAYCDGEPVDGDERVIRCALEAAAPVMADAVAQRILAHMEAHGPQAGFGNSLGSSLRRAWQRHFQIAARVAAFAFTTEADRKRMAAEAITRGDLMVCTDLREPREDGDRD